MRGTRKPRPTAKPPAPAMDSGDEVAGDGEGKPAAGFFACYLLSSLSSSHKGHTYIGYTVNPRRRIRQHNGEMRSGASRTKKGRPWEMILCIYGFPSNVAALQFEWAWQHPTESLAVRKAASSFKSFSGVANKIKLAYTMLSLPAWENLKLTVNFFSTKYMKFTAACPRLPKQMRANVCVMNELPCYVEGYILEQNDYENEDEDAEEESSIRSVYETTISDVSVKGDANHLERASSDCLFDTMVSDRRTAESNEVSYSAESPKHGSDNDLIEESTYHYQPPCDRLNWITSENLRERMESEDSYCFTESSRPSDEYNRIPNIKTPSMLDTLVNEDAFHVGCLSRDKLLDMRNLDDSVDLRDFKSWRRIKSVKRTNDCSRISPRKASKPNKRLPEIGVDHLRHVSIPISDNDASSSDERVHNRESNVIDLSTPYNHKSSSHTMPSSEIIDLTDSPVIFQL